MLRAGRAQPITGPLAVGILRGFLFLGDGVGRGVLFLCIVLCYKVGLQPIRTEPAGLGLSAFSEPRLPCNFVGLDMASVRTSPSISQRAPRSKP